ncbi:TauD-domain-containing protein [Annulohypoxylon stygium]|nr:TauD-domain-containing protein [Annulohypoxylon stygium]
MAPSAITTETEVETPSLPQTLKTRLLGAYKELAPVKYDKDVEEGKTALKAAKYPNYLPTWNPNQKYPPLQPFEHYEHGKDADTSFPELLAEGVAVNHLTPTIGTEIRGVQLSSLSNAGKDQLARFVAERKVVAFRDQDFADLPIEKALEFGGYFGRHHIHPTSGSPEGHPEIHLVHRGEGDKTHETFFENRTSSVAWHSDVSYEQQPPGTTFLYILDKPETGGDTLFVDAVEAYNRLSPLFQERLHGLKATHSGIEQVNASIAKNSIKRREPVVSVHPIVRTHPATGEKSLYINPQFTRDIIGLKKEESDAILKFLYDHLAYGADFQARVKWEEGTVVVWDNRVTQHSALLDWKSGQRRHLARITPQAERPYQTPYEPSS